MILFVGSLFLVCFLLSALVLAFFYVLAVGVEVIVALDQTQ
jgi:hypothetical protein